MMMQCVVSRLGTLNSPPHTTLCCPILLQGAGLVPMGAHGIGHMGILTGGRWELLPRTSSWIGGAGGTPRLVPTCGHPWGPVQLLPIAGGSQKAPYHQPYSKIMNWTQWGGQGVMGALGPCGYAGQAPRGWERGCPTPQPSESRAPLLVRG